jgi:hypothetical protein
VDRTKISNTQPITCHSVPNTSAPDEPSAQIGPTASQCRVHLPSSPAFLTLPYEIQENIVINLSPSVLSDLQSVSRYLYGLVTPRVYTKAYNALVTHRAGNTSPISCKRLALEKEQILRAWQALPLKKEERLLRTSSGYWLRNLFQAAAYGSDRDVESTAENSLIFLQVDSKPRDSAWYEAVATALLMQGRTTEAVSYYQSSCEMRALEDAPPHSDRVHIVHARFGIPETAGIALQPWDQLPDEIRTQAFMAACCGNKIATVRLITGIGLRDEVVVLGAKYAALHGRRDCIRFLADLPPVRMRIDECLAEAAMHGNLAGVEELVAQGASPHACFESNTVGMHSGFGLHQDKLSVASAAALYDRVNILHYLHKKRVHLTAPKTRNGGPTPLWQAVDSGASAAVVYLLRLKGRAERIEGEGQSPLQRAMLRANVPILKAMVAHKLDLKRLVKSKKHGWLHHLFGELNPSPAKQDAIVQAARFLFSGGHADINAADASGWSALHYAVDAQCEPVVACLLALGAQVPAQEASWQATLKRAGWGAEKIDSLAPPRPA